MSASLLDPFCDLNITVLAYIMYDVTVTHVHGAT